MVAAFFDSLSRRVRAVQPDGTVETVQCMPRGGWFKRLYVSATEYDIRLLRAALTNAPDSCFPHGRSHQKVTALLRSAGSLRSLIWGRAHVLTLERKFSHKEMVLERLRGC